MKTIIGILPSKNSANFAETRLNCTRHEYSHKEVERRLNVDFGKLKIMYEGR